MNFTKGLLTEYHAIMATESRGCKTRDGGERDNLVLGLEKTFNFASSLVDFSQYSSFVIRKNRLKENARQVLSCTRK